MPIGSNVSLKDKVIKNTTIENQRTKKPRKQNTRKVESQSKKTIKPINSRKPKHQISRTVKSQRTRKPKKQNWQAGRTQISLWLPDTLVTDIKIQAVRERKKLSAVAVERLTRAAEK